MKKVVIIGGGFAGALAARKLEDSFAVTLIDAKDYFEFTPSILRTLIEPGHYKKIEVLHRRYLHQAQVVDEIVESFDSQAVVTKTKKYPYDYLIIATGSRYNLPIKAENMVLAARARELKNYAQKLAKAESVLIIGGGIVGVELAAEIIEAFPDKKITIIHAHSELIERNPRKARDYARQFLEKRGVKLIFNELVAEFKEQNYKTDKNNLFKPDLAFFCTGIKPNYQLLVPYCAGSLNERKAVEVNNYLQVKGFKNIFAAGDITATKEEKLAQGAEKQAKVVVKNIINLDCGRTLKEYRVKKLPMVISLGKWRGIFIKDNVVVTGIIPGILKTLIEWKTMWKFRR